MVSNCSKISVSKPVAHAAMKTFMRHLWYLSETLIVVAFFDTEVSATQKTKMVTALSKSGEDSPPPRADPIDGR